MECRKLEVSLVSACNLPNIRNMGQMKVYAETSLQGEPRTAKRTPVDIQGETNPRWNSVIDYTISESTVWQEGVNLVVKLYCKRTLGDKLVGQVRIPVKSLSDMGLNSEQRVLSYTVPGTNNGRLNIAYRFGEKVVVQRPSRWKKAAIGVGLGVGFLALVGGAMVLLNRDDGVRDDGVGEYNERDDEERMPAVAPTYVQNHVSLNQTSIVQQAQCVSGYY